MATWGDFIKDVNVVRMQNGMYVKVDEVITLWEELNKLRASAPPPHDAVAAEQEALQALQDAVAAEREACAREVEEFAEACAAEADTPEVATAYLRAAASIIREKDEPLPEAEVLDEQPAPEPTGEEG